MILVKHHNIGNYEPYFYFALEDYLLNEVLRDNQSFFFTWIIKGVVVGKNQIIENEVNLDYTTNNNIAIYRRPTGGGTVYADERNTMFSIVTKREQNFSFKKHLVHIINALKPLGVTLEFSGRNDILFEGKKVSGNAFLQNRNGMLLHGTLLYDCDLETMVRAITPSDEKLISKGVESVRNRVVNLKPYLKGLTQSDLIKHIEVTLTDEDYILSDKEIAMLKERAKKYASKEWIYRQQAAYTKTLKKRIPGGLFDISLTLQDGLIKAMNITGDFFDLRPVNELSEQFLEQVYNEKNMRRLLKKVGLKSYFLDLDEDAFSTLLLSGIIEK